MSILCGWASIEERGRASGCVVGNTIVANATEAHNNMPPYLVVYMWQRTA